MHLRKRKSVLQAVASFFFEQISQFSVKTIGGLHFVPANILRLTLLGVGAMNSPRFAPAGLLVELGRSRVMIDGGPGAEPAGELDDWLVTDAKAELIRSIR